MVRTYAWRWLVAFMVLITLGAAACSDGNGGGDGGVGPAAGRQQDDGDGDGDGDAAEEASGGGERDGCELVTQEDAEEILLEPATQSEEGTETPVVAASCVWEVDKETSFKLLQFNLFEGEQFYGEDAFRESGDVELETVEGLGDRAFFYESLGTSLQVLDGDIVVTLDVSGFNVQDVPLDKETVKEQLKALARKVLSRI